MKSMPPELKSYKEEFDFIYKKAMSQQTVDK